MHAGERPACRIEQHNAAQRCVLDPASMQWQMQCMRGGIVMPQLQHTPLTLLLTAARWHQRRARAHLDLLPGQLLARARPLASAKDKPGVVRHCAVEPALGDELAHRGACTPLCQVSTLCWALACRPHAPCDWGYRQAVSTGQAAAMLALLKRRQLLSHSRSCRLCTYPRPSRRAGPASGLGK